MDAWREKFLFDFSLIQKTFSKGLQTLPESTFLPTFREHMVIIKLELSLFSVEFKRGPGRGTEITEPVKDSGHLPQASLASAEAASVASNQVTEQLTAHNPGVIALNSLHICNSK